VVAGAAVATRRWPQTLFFSSPKWRREIDLKMAENSGRTFLFKLYNLTQENVNLKI